MYLTGLEMIIELNEDYYNIKERLMNINHFAIINNESMDYLIQESEEAQEGFIKKFLKRIKELYDKFVKWVKDKYIEIKNKIRKTKKNGNVELEEPIKVQIRTKVPEMAAIAYTKGMSLLVEAVLILRENPTEEGRKEAEEAIKKIIDEVKENIELTEEHSFYKLETVEKALEGTKKLLDSVKKSKEKFENELQRQIEAFEDDSFAIESVRKFGSSGILLISMIMDGVQANMNTLLSVIDKF